MAVAMAAVALAALSGCVPAPKPGTIDIVGDSILFQTFWHRQSEFTAGSPAGASIVSDARLGIGFPDMLAPEAKRAASGRPATLVIALGTNDAGPVDGGWTSADDAELRALMASVSPTACVVLVLPGYADKPAVPSTYRADLTAGRKAMRQAAADRAAKGRATFVADWGAVALAHPELTGDDGIHLAADAPAIPERRVNEAAGKAWTKVLWDGVRHCPS